MPPKRYISQATDQAKLLAELDDHIRQNLQAHAAGVIIAVA